MPHRLNEFRAKIQFVTNAAMPMMISKAAAATGKVSNTQYVQHAIVDALVRDLGLDKDEMLALLPKPAGPAAFLTDGTRHTQPKAQHDSVK